MRRVLIGPLVVALAQTVSAGSLSNFDKPIKDEIRVKSPRFLDPCHVGGPVLERLGQDQVAHVAAPSGQQPEVLFAGDGGAQHPGFVHGLAHGIA